MTGTMTAPDVQGLARRTLSALEDAERGGNEAEIRRAAGQLDDAIASIRAEVDRDQAEESRLSAEHQRLASSGRQHASRANETATTLQLVSQERFVGETTLKQLTTVRTELTRQMRRREAASRDPQAARFVETNLTKAREALEALNMPQPAAAVLLNLVATERVTPTVAQANYLFFASALRNQAGVPEESRDEVAARLAKIHFDSSVSNDAIATAFREYMALPRTEAGEAMRLTATFAQRLGAMASARGTEPNSLSSDDVDTVRRETGDDFNWFMGRVGNDMMIATTLVSGVSSGLNRDRMLEIYRGFDADPQIDSVQAAVFAAALSGRAAEPGANLTELRAETMRNYRSIMDSRPPEGMEPVDRFTAASYAAQGYGVPPAIVPGHIPEHHHPSSHAPSFWDIYGPAIVMSQILNNDSRWDRRYGGYVSDYGAGYADGVRSARRAGVPWTPSAGSTTWRSPSGTGLPSSPTPVPVTPPRPIDVGTIARDAARAERADGGALARARSTTMGTDGVRVNVPGVGVVTAAEARQRAAAAAAPRVAPSNNGPIIFGTGGSTTRDARQPTREPVREAPRAAPVQVPTREAPRAAPVQVPTREAPRAAPVMPAPVVTGSGRTAPTEPVREAPRAAPVQVAPREAPRAAPVQVAPREAPRAAPVQTAPREAPRAAPAAPVRSAPSAPVRSAPSAPARSSSRR